MLMLHTGVLMALQELHSEWNNECIFEHASIKHLMYCQRRLFLDVKEIDVAKTLPSVCVVSSYVQTIKQCIQ